MKETKELIKEARDRIAEVYYQLDGSQILFTNEQLLTKLEVAQRILLKLFIRVS